MGGEIGRPSNIEIDERRKLVKEQMLKNKSVTVISSSLKISSQTVRKDIEYWRSYYQKLAVKNHYIVQKQFARIEELLDEVQIIKQKYWELFEELENKSAKSNVILDEWYTKREELSKILKEAVDSKLSTSEIKKAEKELKKHGVVPPRVNSFYTAKLDSLKTIMQRIEQESKLLNLLNPSQLLQTAYISKDILLGVMQVFKTIIQDLVPEDKQRFAFSRLQKVELDTVEDAEIIVDNKQITDDSNIEEKDFLDTVVSTEPKENSINIENFMEI